ncbi:MAG TPA: hypothetical protein VFP62_02250 [Burkholderiales bacterium]|nr:hypothetical protein [Burkholderiales bacterium]
MTQDEKLDEALRGTFPASDAFWLEPQAAAQDGSIERRRDEGAPAR